MGFETGFEMRKKRFWCLVELSSRGRNGEAEYPGPHGGEVEWRDNEMGEEEDEGMGGGSDVEEVS